MANVQLLLDQFADNLIREAGFDKLPEKFQQDFRDQIINEAHSRLGLLVTAELPEDKLGEYGQLLAGSQDVENDVKLAEFTASAIPYFSDKAALILGAYQAEFISEAKAALAKGGT